MTSLSNETFDNTNIVSSETSGNLTVTNETIEL